MRAGPELQNRLQTFNPLKLPRRPPRGVRAARRRRASGARPGPSPGRPRRGRALRDGERPAGVRERKPTLEAPADIREGRARGRLLGPAGGRPRDTHFPEAVHAWRGVGTRGAAAAEALPSPLGAHVRVLPRPRSYRPGPPPSRSCLQLIGPETLPRRGPRGRRLLRAPGAAVAAGSPARAPAATCDWLPGEGARSTRLRALPSDWPGGRIGRMRAP